MVKFNLSKIKYLSQNLFSQTKRLFSKKAALKHYVKKSILLDGLSEEQTRGKLKMIGWTKEDIFWAFGELKNEIKKAEKKREQKKWSKGETFFIKKEKGVKNIMAKDLFVLSFRIFKVKPVRTILTIMGIGVSFGTIFFLLSLGYGLQDILLSQISSEEALLSMDVYSVNPEAFPLDDAALKKFSSIPYVKKVDPVIVAPGQIDSGVFASEASFYGVSEPFFALSGIRFQEGEVFGENKNEIVVSSVFAYAFNMEEAKDLLGKEVKLSFYVTRTVDGIEEVETAIIEEPFRIVGVVENEVDNYAYLPLSKISSFGFPYGLTKVVVKDMEYMEEVRNKVLDLGFNTIALSDTVDQANKIFQALQFILALFGMAALVVAVIGMINTMTISLLERINEVGIMKVLGVAESDIQKIFLLESTMMGFLGGVSGLMMGWAGSQLFNFGIGFLAKSLGGTSVSLFSYPMWFVGMIIVFASVVGFMTGVGPSKKAASLDPLQALRYK